MASGHANSNQLGGTKRFRHAGQYDRMVSVFDSSVVEYYSVECYGHGAHYMIASVD